MGAHYTKEQQKEFEMIKKLLDKAFREKTYYKEYKGVKKTMNQQLTQKKRLFKKLYRDVHS